MVVESVGVRDFRNLAPCEVALGPGLNLIWGENGAGKTNLLEATYSALAGRSCRTRDDRETIAFGQSARAQRGGRRRRRPAPDLPVLGQPRRRAPPSRRRLADDRRERCAAPGAGRVHARPPRPGEGPAGGAPRAPRRVLRSAVARARRGPAPLLASARAAQLAPRPDPRGPRRDREPRRLGPRARRGRGRAERRPGRGGRATRPPPSTRRPRRSGSPGAGLRYRPRSEADTAGQLAAELAERREADVARGYTGWGPHHDELAFEAGGRALRRYGSQGQQRTALLALLFAERRTLLDDGRPAPLMLLDDVSSELDAAHRRLLVEHLADGGGQALLTATEPDHLPSLGERHEIAIRDGRPLGPAGGERAGGVSARGGPKRLGDSIRAVRADAQPATLLAAVQGCWRRGARRADRGAGVARARARRRDHGGMPSRDLGSGARSDAERAHREPQPGARRAPCGGPAPGRGRSS